MKRFAGIAVLGLLAGCGGGGTGTVDMSGTAPTIAQLQARFEKANAVQQEVEGYYATTPKNVPTSGSSTFTGPAVLGVDRGTASYFLMGDSALTMNFGTQAMSGQVKNLAGATGNGNTFAVGGQINYSTGRIGVLGDPVLFATQYSGNLTAGRDTIVVNGTLFGNFQGNRTQGAIRTRAIQAIDATPGSGLDQYGLPESMSVTVNGKPATGQFAIVGQN